MNKYEYKVQGVDYEVEIEDVEGNIAKVSVNGIPFEVEMKQRRRSQSHRTSARYHHRHQGDCRTGCSHG